MSVKILGNINDRPKDVTWYLLENGKLVTFHKAYKVHPGDDPNAFIVFYSDSETFASITAQRLGLKPVLILNASDSEAEIHIEAHDIKVKERIHV